MVFFMVADNPLIILNLNERGSEVTRKGPIDSKRQIHLMQKYFVGYSFASQNKE